MTWDDEKSTGDELTSPEWNDHVADQKNHSERHEEGGVDEITVEGLSGELADDQDPKDDVTRDIVEAFLDGGTNVTVSRDADTLTIDTSALNDQEVADKVGEVVEGGAQTTVSYDSGTQTATITIDAPSQSEFDDHSDRHEEDGPDALSLAVDQIQNFGSNVLSSIEDNTIAPSDITNLWDGTNVTANVNNESVSTDGLENGVAGEGNTINGLWGDTGEIVLLGYSETVSDPDDVTLDTFTRVGPRFGVTNYDWFTNYTNIEEIYASLEARWQNLDGGSEVRLQDESNGETLVSISKSAGGFDTERDRTDITSVIETYSDTRNIEVQAKVDAGTLEWSAEGDPKWAFWGQIG